MTIFRRRLIVLVIAVVLLVLTIGGHTDWLIEKAGAGKLGQADDEYLQRSFDKAMSGLLVVSVLKAGLDIIEGSEVGFSVGVEGNLQVGDIVQPAYDYVDTAWKTMVLGSVMLLAMKYMLAAARIADQWFLAATMAVWVMLAAAKWWTGAVRLQRVLGDAAAVLIVLTAAVYYVLPLSVYTAAYLSKNITQPTIEESQKGLKGLQNKVFPEASKNPDGFIDRVRDIKNRITEIAAAVKANAKNLAIYCIRIIAGYLFDCVVFPVGVFWLLVWMTRLVTNYVLGVGRVEQWNR